MKKTLLLLGLSSLLTFCKKNDPGVDSSIASLFPNDVGDNWTYQSVSSPSQTLMVQIVGNGTLPNGTGVKLWKYTYPAFIDSMWVAEVGDTVIFYTTSYTEQRRLVFPLTVGKTWYTNAVYGDTTKVLAETTTTVPLGQYTDVFEVAQKVGPVTNSSVNDTLWLEEHIGFVKLSQNEYNLGPEPGNGVWELTSYSLK